MRQSRRLKQVRATGCDWPRLAMPSQAAVTPLAWCCGVADEDGRASTVRGRLTELGQKDPPIEIQFSMPDQWSRHLFLALCRRYGFASLQEKRPGIGRAEERCGRAPPDGQPVTAGAPSVSSTEQVRIISLPAARRATVAPQSPSCAERKSAWDHSRRRPLSFVIYNTPVDVRFTSAGWLNYPCRTPAVVKPRRGTTSWSAVESPR
jgi:hypothetical protein